MSWFDAVMVREQTEFDGGTGEQCYTINGNTVLRGRRMSVKVGDYRPRRSGSMRLVVDNLTSTQEATVLAMWLGTGNSGSKTTTMFVARVEMGMACAT